LDCATGLAATVGDWERAARLHGATEALMQQMGYHREPSDEASLPPFIARTTEALGSTAFAASQLSGRALSYDEAMAEARSWLDLTHAAA